MVASTIINKGLNGLTADDNSSNNRLKKRSTFATRELIDRAIVERISPTRIEGGVQHRFLNNNCFLEVNEKYAKVARSVQVTPKKRGGVSVSLRMEPFYARCPTAKPATEERFNNTLRQRVSRLVRKTLSFFKSLENHIGAIGYFIHHYNASLLV
jgi:hypothetical protein